MSASARIATVRDFFDFATGYPEPNTGSGQDRILRKRLEEMQNIVAAISLLKDVPEPKTNGIRSGYAPHHKFPGIDWLASGFHEYQDAAVHFPGETIEAKIRFVSWEYLRDVVSPGVQFEVRELDRLIGQGIVKSVTSA